MFYVAKQYDSKTVMPVIMEAFETYDDAIIYVNLMSRVKQCKYVILKACEL